MSMAALTESDRPGARPSTVDQLIEIAACERPDATAIVAPGRPPLPYGRFARHVQDVIATLNAIGIGRGDRVAVALPQGPEMAVTVLAVAAGATCSPLNPTHRTRECVACLGRLRAQALILQAGTDSPARAAAASQGLPIIELSQGRLTEAGLFTLRSSRAREPVRQVPPRPDDIALLLPTSGTTAGPKLVPLSHANLCASAHSMRTSLSLEPTDRCLNLMPLFHVHGFMALLSLLGAGGSVVCPPTFDASRVLEWLDECRPTWYTAVPAMHRAILGQAERRREVMAPRPLRFIRSASAALPEPLQAGLERVFGVPVIQAYGMTEAAHQIATTPLPPKERRMGSVGLATGTEIAIVDESGCPVPAGETGEIVIRGPSVMRGYEEDPVANASAFVGQWFRTGDLGRLDPDGYLFLTGRLTEIINRGGEKISPQEVDAVLTEHPSVADAVTFAVPHPTLGEDLVAAVMLREHASATVRDLRAFAAARLADVKVPSRVMILAEIPKGETGKPRRLGLADRLGLPARGGRPVPAPDASAGPRTPTEAALVDIWAQVLEVEPVGVHDDFFELGGDSMLATLIASRVREVLGAELAVRDVLDSPTIADLAGQIDAGHRPYPHGAAPPVPVAARDGGLPLSFAQESFWLLEQLARGSAPYHVHAGFRLLGPLDVGALGRSLEGIVTRHEALRTVFINVDGHLRQVIAAPSSVPLPVIDLRAMPETEREPRARRMAADEAGRPFALSRDPGFRATLLQLGDADHLLLLTAHEAVADPWSVDILLREMSELYAALGAGRASPLAPLPIQYADYTVWQREWLHGPILDAQLAYWRRRLAGAPTLDLPTDRPRPTVPTFRAALRSFRLSDRLTARLKAVSRQEGVTLFMTLLAAFQVLLHRYSGQDDITVGSPVAGRTRVELEGLIGCFINTLILRTDLSGSPTFRGLLARVRTVAVEAYTHQDVPFEKVVEALHPNRTLSHPPLFQVMFALENAPTWTPTFSGLSAHPLEVPRETVTVDLSLSMKETSQGLIGTLAYSADLFEAETITRMVGHFETLLDGAVADPDRPVAQLPLLTEPEHRRILLEWNDTRADYPQRCVHQLVEAQAARTPDAVAVVFEDRSLTYRELDQRANRLAHHLRRLGVGPDDLVGIYVERSLEMVVGLLGILKAGGAYLPLDPDYPRDRLAFMLQDAGARVVVTQQDRAVELPRSTAATVCVDALPPPPDAGRAEPVDVLVTPDHLAYVIYTSGSTGRPKGVLLSHRALGNLLEAMRRVPGCSAGDVVLALTTISFDIATLELFLPLIVGARVVVVSREVAMDPARLDAAVRRTGATVMQATPTTWRLLVEAGWPGRPDLTMLSGGEVLPRKLADQLRERGARLWNCYGPTETTIYSTGARVEAGAPITIGRPIANTAVYLLDRHGAPVPIGVPGELYIGGDGLARGYLNRAALTADAFVPNPFSPEPTARLYKTGDRARYRPDGAIEFLGRQDDQVKLRGVRIELGEIEAVLAQHPAVTTAAVALREDTPGAPRLVAYVVPDRAPGPRPEELIAHLKRALPEQMVPATFVALDTLPCTPNGKVDRDALPRPLPADPGAHATFVAPRTPIEAALARIWGEILGLERVGVHDTLFELGGHSLMAIRILSRIHEAFGVELALRRLFETPTVAELALAVAQAGGDVARRPVGRGARADGEMPAQGLRGPRWAEGDPE